MIVPNLLASKPVVTEKEQTYPVIHPATSQVVHFAHASSVIDAANAIGSCFNALPRWSAQPIKARIAVFLKAAALVADEETGWAKRLRDSNRLETEISDWWSAEQVAGIPSSINTLCSFANEALEEHTVTLHGSSKATISREPYGVCLAIPAWNAVHPLTSRSIITPLLAGNTVVLKTSEVTPHTQLLWAELLYEAGLMEGALSVVHVATKDAPLILEALISDKRIRHVNFTGSTRVGSILAGLAGKYLKPTIMELGGKAPVLVLPDANLAAAANNILFGTLMNAGQICMSTERVIVSQSKYLDLCSAIQAAWKESTQGVTKGLFTMASAERVRSLLAEAKSMGSTNIIASNSDPAGEAPTSSVLIPPTILAPVNSDMRIYREETFAPVGVIIVIPDETKSEEAVIDEMINIANDSDYGLSAAVWSTDVAKAKRVARRIESGAVHINSPSPADPQNVPHGGWKHSGWGRFNGIEGIRSFTQTRTIEFDDESNGIELPLAVFGL